MALFPFGIFTPNTESVEKLPNPEIKAPCSAINGVIIFGGINLTIEIHDKDEWSKGIKKSSYPNSMIPYYMV